MAMPAIRRRAGAAALLAGLWLALVLLPSGHAAAQDAPQFWINNLQGERFDSQTHQGPIVVSFFFVGCVPCIKEIPLLHAFMAKEFPHAGLLFVDPIRDDSQQDVEEFADRLGVPRAFFYRDPLSRLQRKFFSEQIGYPTIVGVKNARRVFTLNGINADALERIRAALSG